MQSKIQELKKEYGTVEKELNDPNIFANPQKSKKLNNRFTELKEIIEVANLSLIHI